MDLTLALILIFGAAAVSVLLTWLATRGRAAAMAETAATQARADVQVEVATLTERLRAMEVDVLEGRNSLLEVQREAKHLRTELDTSSNERARLEERATRVPQLEAELRELHRKLEEVEDELNASEEENATLEERASRVPKLESSLAQAEGTARAMGQQLADLRSATSAEISGLKSNVEAQTETGKRLSAERDAAQIRIQSSEQENFSLSQKLLELQTRTDKERESFQAQLQLLQDAKTALTDQFRNLANEILEEKSKRFAEQNQTSLGALLDPLRTRLSEFQGKVEEVYVQESKDRSALQEQVKSLLSLNQTLSEDAKNLTLALKGSTKTQGNWGELILERVLESSGLRKGIEYVVQDSQTREDGTRAVPDVVIHLPEERRLIIDAKVSLTAYERHVSAESDEARALALKAHLDSVRGHIRGLSDRRYQDLYGVKSLDFVLAFIPIEPAFMMAVTNDDTLFNEAWAKNVLLVSPSTLLFVVRTVAHLWRQETQSRHAQEIAKRGGELYDKLSGFVADLQNVGTRLKQAKDAFDLAENKLVAGKGNVIRQAEMLKELGVKPSKTLPAPLVELSQAETTLLPVDGNGIQPSGSEFPVEDDS